MLKTYNGFDHKARMEGDRIQKEYFAKYPEKRPTVCSVCSSTHKVQLHLEDYNKPITGIIPLCFRCHMMVHCRFRARKAWDNYKAIISEGVVLPPGRSFEDIKAFLCGQLPETVRGPARGMTFLDTLE